MIDNCPHTETFFWPFFDVGPGLIGSETCLACCAKLVTKILVGTVLYDYVTHTELTK